MSSNSRVGRRVAVAVGLALLVVLAWGALLALDVRRVEGHLRDAERAAGEAADAVRAGDLDTATRQLARAEDALGPAVAGRSGPVWWLARRLPLVSPSVETVDAIVDTAGAGVDVASEVTDVLADLAAAWEDTGRLRLDPFVRLRAVLEGDAVGRLDRGRDRLRHPTAGPVPGRLRDARAELLARADDLAGSLAPVRDVVAVVPTLLGSDRPRRYLVAMQNSAELRGTGGLIGFHAVLTADGGRLSLSEPAPDEAFAHVPAGAVPLSPEQQAWLGHVNPQTGLSNANLDPDLTRTGPLLVAMHEAATGVRLDGVLAVDPVGLATLMGPDDVLEVPEDVLDPAGALPAEVPSADLPRVMLVDAYQALGGDTPERKAFHAALAAAAFDGLLDLEWDEDLLDRLAFAVAGRHLQVHSTDTDLQAQLVELGVAGRLAPGAGRDLLAVTANNAGSSKQDVHVRHALSARVRVTPEAADAARVGEGDATTIGDPVAARRDVTLGVRVDNPLRDDGWDDYIVTTRVAGQGQVPSLRAANRTWFTWWAPGTTDVVGGGSDDGPVRAAVGTIGGLTRVDDLVTTPSRSSRSGQVAMSGPVALSPGPDGLTYRLTLWHQAKAIADRVDLVVAGAPGWEVVAGTVQGRSDTGRLGFGEDEEPLELVVEDGRARITGTAVSDVHVDVTLAPVGVTSGGG